MNDVVLAIYSDRLFMAAVGVYVLAMVLHAAEYATLRAARAPATEARPADTPVTVAAAAGRTNEPLVRERRRGPIRTTVPLAEACPTTVPLVGRRRRGPGPTGSAGRR